MPKIVKRSKEEATLLEEVKAEYGWLITLANVQTLLGVGSHHTALKWCDGLRSVDVNGRKKYYASDVVSKMIANTQY